MDIKNISLAWISTADFKKSKTFWTEVVGLQVSSIAEEYQWVELKGQEGAILGVGMCNKPQDPVQPGQNAVVTFTVDNLDKKMADMKAKDVKFIGEVIEVPGHVKMIFFADPDGNKFQLVQMLGNS
jgi:predicted enzyme related to lactoylglutathione lyase